ncbi:MAG: XrtA/PEP-CTERM system histidine kinase PrsK [Novosphingobium sp.]
MIGGAASLPWAIAGGLTGTAGAVSATIAALWIAGRRERFGDAGLALVTSLVFTAVWSASIAAAPLGDARQGLFESLSNLGWLLVVYRLFSGDGRDTSLAPIRPVALALGFVEILHLGIELLDPALIAGASAQLPMLQLTITLRLLVAIGGLVMAHNLYSGAAPQARMFLRWPALALGTMWGFELNLYSIAYLSKSWPDELAALQGFSIISLAVLMVLGGVRGSEQLRFRPSRGVAFQSASLLVIGGYFAAMYAIANWLSYVGGNFARLMEFGFLIAASVAALLLLPSRRLRGWLRVTLVKHLFQHRYDYREEWLRVTRTMGNCEDPAAPLEQRAVQAIGDIADSPAGLLFAPGDHRELVLAAQWNWPLREVPTEAMSALALTFFETTGLIVDLDDLRAGKTEHGEAEVVPQWLLDEPGAWALVPLIHFDRLTGLVVLARPTPARRFDWEDFDLLRIAGRQLASYLAEHAVQAALAEASRFDDFHRRIAFVMHDIKNLASQLSLLARNAELHADNPAFRADMLVTLRNSADKLNNLLARLSRYVSGGGAERLEKVDAGAVVTQVAAQFREQYPVMVAECQDCEVSANRESLEQVLVHLVQNGIDASQGDVPVVLGVTTDGLHACIEIVDSGCGMSPDFVRNRLFKPFVSSKQGGFGIGAFEARELVRAMRGRLEVDSREGLGSRFIVRLPLADAEGIFDAIEQSGDESSNMTGANAGRKVA